MKLRPRYFVALLWHWSIPFVLGVSVGLLILGFQLVTVGPEIEAGFVAAIAAYCGGGQ